MAVKLGDAIVFIRGDRRQLDDDFDDSERRTQSWTSKIGSTIRTGIGVAMGNMATMAAQKVMQLGGALADMVGEALPIEGIRASFAGLTGDADAALAVLRRGALGMVSDAELMRTYNEAAQLVGKTFADQLPDAMGYLSKVSAATGQDMGFMLDSLTKGVGRLSPMILDNLGIQVNLAEANAAYADQLGITVEEMDKSQQQAAVMAQVLDKLEANTAAMPDVTGNAATAMAQFKTTVQNLKDQVGEALIPVLMELLEPLGELITEYGPDVIAWVKVAIDWLGKNLPKWIEVLREVFTRFFSKEAPEIWQTLKRVGDEVWTFLQEIMQQVINWVEENLPLIIENSQELADFWTNVLVPVTEGAWELIKTIISTALDVILGVIKLAMQVATGDWEGAWETIKGIAETIWEGIKEAFNTFVETILSVLGTTLEDFKETWRSNLEMAKIIIRDKLNQIKQKFDDLMNKVRGILSGNALYEVGRQWIQGLINGVGVMAGALVDAVKRIVQKALDAIWRKLGVSPRDTEDNIPEEDETFPLGAGLGLSGAPGPGMIVGGLTGIGRVNQSVTMYGVNILSEDAGDLFDQLASFQVAVV